MHADQKAGESRRTDALRRRFQCACPRAVGNATLRIRFQTNGQEEPRHGLKLMNATAKQGSTGFEKNKVTSLRDCSNQMRNAGMKQRLTSSDPNDWTAPGNNFAHPLVRNRMVGILMQKFRRIHKLNGATASAQTRLLREPAHREVRS